ncbi:hypothetical protein Agub_g7467 [Astrephomene gubernaculifera]|uniref:Uncharacterized protein n=1 Tax=Astrephomene gubernaculifera TaxID=47775 RepID=A0AAD3DS56_9CHLO|nr:hypothetical protein Agub_g7467 [Astrephomene gubernaculifera]
MWLPPAEGCGCCGAAWRADGSEGQRWPQGMPAAGWCGVRRGRSGVEALPYAHSAARRAAGPASGKPVRRLLFVKKTGREAERTVIAAVCGWVAACQPEAVAWVCTAVLYERRRLGQGS